MVSAREWRRIALNDTELQEVRGILTDLQAEIRRHRVAIGAMEVIAPPDPLFQVREKQVVNPHLPIGWPVMPRGLRARLVAYVQKIVRRLLRWYINPLVAQQNEYNLAATDLLASLQGATEELRERVERVEGGALLELVQTYERRLDQITEDNEARFRWLQQLQEQGLEETRLRLQRLENRARASREALTPIPPLQTQAEIDYFLLGAQFRNRVQISRWLSDYDDLFRGVAAAQTAQPASLPVLDVGCGRGELVAHLIELGLSAYGIDMDADALAIGQEQGLDLRRVDAFTHLGGLADNSLAAIVMIQVIEHFEPAPLLNLLQLMVRKLAPGGFVLAETINPTCLFALSNWYLMDPSHRTPMHSETTKFLLRQVGLEHLEIRFLHPVPEGGQLRRLDPEGILETPALATLFAQLQHNTEQLNQLLYGAQDYAAIGYKSPASGEAEE
jgi:SAM-dependent methyltransferase